jgi:hypothetical protein
VDEYLVKVFQEALDLSNLIHVDLREYTHIVIQKELKQFHRDLITQKEILEQQISGKLRK